MRIHNVRFKVATAFLALALIAGAAVLSLSQGPGVASADSGTADVTFTKWVTQATAFPRDMKGVVGGDVGTGTFTGEVLGEDTTVAGMWLGHALYHFNGGTQSLTADLRVTQNAALGTAALTGVVTVGYLKDALVTGEYTVMPVCPIATPGNLNGTRCFKGSLHIAVTPTASFTKWVTQATALPRDMKGVVGGDVGAGTFTGEVLGEDTTAAGSWRGHALYHINGGTQSLTADLRVTQSAALGTAVITGVVTAGYLKDALVSGEYTVMAKCPIATPGNLNGTLCFRGTLHMIVAPAASFTKWVTQATAFPWDMKGVVGGDVGTGTFTGEVLGEDTSVAGAWLGHALYHINGGKQSFTADLRVSQSAALGTAVLTGVVSAGYLKGSVVSGEYTVMATCPIATPGNLNGTLCFRGTLHIIDAATAPAVAPVPAPTAPPTATPVAAATPAPVAPAAPSAGTGLAKSDGSSRAILSFFGPLALMLAGAAGGGVALRRTRRSPRP